LRGYREALDKALGLTGRPPVIVITTTPDRFAVESMNGFLIESDSLLLVESSAQLGDALAAVLEPLSSGAVISFDVSTLMRLMAGRVARVGTGNGAISGATQARVALESQGVDLETVTGVVLRICAPGTLTTAEYNTAVSHIMSAAGDDSDVITAMILDDRLESAQVSVIACE
jgi:cell division GTPase FtsZ